MNELVEQGIRERHKWIIANHNLHSVYLLHRHPKLREFYEHAHWTYVDGMPLVALGRLYGYPLQRDQRVTNVDWTGPLMELAASRGWRVFNLGSSRQVAERDCEVTCSLSRIADRGERWILRRAPWQCRK